MSAATPHPLQCRCGKLRGQVLDPRQSTHGRCYCRDCQAYAHFLGNAAEILDPQGGSDVVATLPANVVFSQGTHLLVCMALSEKGLLRWYARCCNTPIGNTKRDYRISFVGLVHSCLGDSSDAVAQRFGPVTMVAFGKYAKGGTDAKLLSTLQGMARFGGRLLRARLDGSYRRTPFFDAERGTPIVVPRVLTAAEREQLTRAL